MTHSSIIDLGLRQHYEDAVLYDYEYRRRRSDVRFYRRFAEQQLGSSGHVLELACGSGRVTIGLARQGFDVLGIDLSQPMLERAKARVSRLGRAAKKRVHLLRADMRSFALGRRYPLIVMAFNSFEHLYTRVDVAACLKQVAQHLEPDGRFVFDVQLPDMRWLCRSPEIRWSRTMFRHPGTGKKTEYTTNHSYDPISQIVLIRLYYKTDEDGREDTQVINLSQRKFFPAELEMLLSANGFCAVERYGDFQDHPLNQDAENQVLVCKLRAS